MAEETLLVINTDCIGCG